ncbi:MAG: DUF3225 domain-containing protein [Betaproteobacteria bacterium]|nr:DUF3225 domain-containing protein [Betaproteobacteria bacterium]MDE2123951.1 DUF3225 domain-containing protein [Betaproteobacteria bacterium]MDE2185255.1 DUF3225 domain-containing protein [Betaproteobacteria bacterium]
MQRAISQRAGLQSSAEAAEAAFYEALQLADVDALMRVWADEDDVICVHPGGPRLVGPAAIRASFEQLFAAGPLRITPERALRTVTLGGAVHNVVERVLGQRDLGEQRFAFVLATNVYIKTPDGWRLVLHHASPATAQEAVEVMATSERLH